MVMMLRQCCCGCSLKTGTIILGVLNILGGLGDLIIAITTAAAGNSVNVENEKVFVGEDVALAVFSAILVLVSICLIIGATKGTPALLVPWMVYAIVFLIANTILFIAYAAHYFSIKDTAMGAGSIIAAAIFALLEIYFLLVVYSLYRELKGTAPANHA